jgi:hypothetical protein
VSLLQVLPPGVELPPPQRLPVTGFDEPPTAAGMPGAAGGGGSQVAGQLSEGPSGLELVEEFHGLQPVHHLTAEQLRRRAQAAAGQQ